MPCDIVGEKIPLNRLYEAVNVILSLQVLIIISPSDQFTHLLKICINLSFGNYRTAMEELHHMNAQDLMPGLRSGISHP